MAPRKVKADDAAAVISAGNTDTPFEVDIPVIVDDSPDKIPVFMSQGAAYTTASGAVFEKEKPYQLLGIIEATILMNELPERFRVATVQEVKNFYSIA